MSWYSSSDDPVSVPDSSSDDDSKFAEKDGFDGPATGAGSGVLSSSGRASSSVPGM